MLEGLVELDQNFASLLVRGPTTVHVPEIGHGDDGLALLEERHAALHNDSDGVDVEQSGAVVKKDGQVEGSGALVQVEGKRRTATPI